MKLLCRSNLVEGTNDGSLGLVLGPLVGLKAAIIGKGFGSLRERERMERNQRAEVLGVFIGYKYVDTVSFEATTF